MSRKVVEKRKASRRASDEMIKNLSRDLSNIVKMLNRELTEIDKEVFLISETSPFLGRRKEDWELQVEITRELKKIATKLQDTLKRIP